MFVATGRQMGRRNCEVFRVRRRGFTLAELLLALVLLDLGILALVGASAAVARVESGTRSDARQLATASTRVERTLSTPCGAASAGTAQPARDLVESWTDTPGPNATREVTDSVVLSTSRGSRIVVLRSGGRC
jgi:Tfp pilus assembly protein PilE